MMYALFFITGFLVAYFIFKEEAREKLKETRIGKTAHNVHRAITKGRVELLPEMTDEEVQEMNEPSFMKKLVQAIKNEA